MGNKKPRARPSAVAKVKAPVAKRPRKVAGLGVHGADHPLWRLSLVDHGHPRWGWGGASAEELLAVLAFLKEMEKLTWTEIWDLKTGSHRRRGALHKFIPIDDLCSDAQDGLLTLGLDDASDVWFRFRLGGTRRLWGVVEGNVFFPVWWDPRHEVCPGADR